MPAPVPWTTQGPHSGANHPHRAPAGDGGEQSFRSGPRDNVTGLIREVKTDDGGLHDKDWTYTWYNGTTGTADGTDNCNPNTLSISM